MIRLEKLQIAGFKSFSDRTEVRLKDGITAIVGPNGCGKSNIGDAINWVLGEQSAKMLRGSQMADVIFNGSDARKAKGMAEVSLHLKGAESYEQSDGGKLVVTRRLFRSGESEYRLNGNRSRLKDIQEILRDAKVGARTYATIEQGRIDQVLNAKPKERRGLIEDAAGISGYKHKRRLAQLKLEATHANLLRVNDIVVEVERQIRSVKRQAAKARRYRELRESLRQKQLLHFARHARDLDGAVDDRRKEEAQAKDTEAGVAGELARIEGELAERRKGIEALQQSFRDTLEELHQSERSIDRAQSDIAGLESRRTAARESASEGRRQGGELEAVLEANRVALEGFEDQLKTVSAEVEHLEKEREERGRVREQAETRLQEDKRALEELRKRQYDGLARAAELRNELRSAEQACQAGRSRLARLEADRSETTRAGKDLDQTLHALTERARAAEAEVDRARAEQSELDRRLIEARRAWSEAGEELAQAREHEKSALARLATLQDVETRFAGVSDGVRSLLAAGSRRDIRTLGVVADYIEAAQEVEDVAEDYLKTLLPSVIVEDEQDAQRAAELVRQEHSGRTTLICRSRPLRPTGGERGELPGALTADPRVSGRLQERVRLRNGVNGLLSKGLGDAVLVRDLTAAFELHRDYPAFDYLTLAGDVVYASGMVSVGGGAAANGNGLLAHQRRTAEAQAACAIASEKAGQLQARLDERAAEVESAEVGLRERASVIETAQRRLLDLQIETQRGSDERARSERQAEVLGQELETLREELVALEARVERLGADCREAEEAQRREQAELEAAVSGVTAAEAALGRLGEEWSALRESFAAKREQHQAIVNECKRLTDEGSGIRARFEQATSQVEEGLRVEAEATTQRSDREKELAAEVERRATLDRRSKEVEQELEEGRQGLSERERSLVSRRGELEQLRTRAQEAELARDRAEGERAHLDDLCRQELGKVPAELEPPEAGEEWDLDSIDAAALDEEIGVLREKIEKLGPVNMTAIEEFSELEERQQFLSSQRADLESSMESLNESIRRINRQSKQRFAEAFEAIRRHYQEIFGVLFNGGRGDLRLEDEDDVLESGIEIMAQPPGKRLTSVQLMSGGEKALSAIALLFAIFRYQPSPFCLLDEVDAPLDDSNVMRFARMVREYAQQTQFILITHNKLSMEAADLLYGVTMQEPGISSLISMEVEQATVSA